MASDMKRGSVPPGFWSVWLVVFVDLVGFGIVAPLLPLYADSFGAGAATIGVLFASYSLAQLIFAPIWGRLSDRVGRRPILLVTIAGSAIGSLILGLAPTLAIVFVGRILDGISGATIGVARAVVADVAEKDERSRLMGLLGMAFGLGFILGPAIGALAAWIDISVPFFVAAGLSVVNFGMAWFRLEETRPPGSHAGEMAPPWKIRPSRIIFTLGAISFLAYAAFAAFETTFALLGHDRFDLTASSIAFVFVGIGALIAVIQGGFVGPLARRHGDLPLMKVGLVFSAVGLGVLAFAHTWPMLIAGLFFLIVGQGLTNPTLSAVAAGLVPDQDLGISMGWLQSAGGLARVVGPILGGVLYAWSPGSAYVAAALITGVAWLVTVTAVTVPEHIAK